MPHFHINNISIFTLLAQWGTIDHIQALKDIDCRFNGFDTSFLKNLIDLFNFVLNCRF